MTTEDFRDLALRVLEGTADERDRVRLAEARASRPEFAAEWTALERAWKEARGLAPALGAIGPASQVGGETPPPAPVDALIARTVRAERKPSPRQSARQWRLPIAVAMTLLLFGIVVNNRRASVAAFETAPAWIDQPATQLVASLSPALTRSEASEITILAPAVATDSRTPTIDWVAQPQKTYDVIVAAAADPERPLWRVEAQRPPLRWSSHNPPLSPGSAYLLVVREHGRSLTASQRRFVTGTEAEAPRPATATPEDVANLEAELVRALFAAEPARIGDAWLLWNQLPHESRESGRGKRIHLVLTARLGWTSEFERLAAELAR